MQVGSNFYGRNSVEDARMGKFSSISVVTTPYVHLDFLVY